MRDILLEADGDVALGDDIGYASDSTAQHQRDILLAAKGSYKEHPAAGVDIASCANDSDAELLLRAVRREFSRDGMRVEQVALEGTNLNVNARYE